MLALSLLRGNRSMRAENPFQVPSCFKLAIEQRRRERFKKTVFTVVIATITLLIGLLIEGCVSEHSQLDTGVAENSTAPPAPKPAPTTEVVAPEQKLAPVMFSKAPSVSMPTQPAATAARPATTPLQTRKTTGETIYVVKSGDTLTRIAKTHGTTIKALKSANNLASDKILAGEKLKVPAA